jgi:hypothetical protein
MVSFGYNILNVGWAILRDWLCMLACNLYYGALETTTWYMLWSYNHMGYTRGVRENVIKYKGLYQQLITLKQLAWVLVFANIGYYTYLVVGIAITLERKIAIGPYITLNVLHNIMGTPPPWHVHSDRCTRCSCASISLHLWPYLIRRCWCNGR